MPQYRRMHYRRMHLRCLMWVPRRIVQTLPLYKLNGWRLCRRPIRACMNGWFDRVGRLCMQQKIGAARDWQGLAGAGGADPGWQKLAGAGKDWQELAGLKGLAGAGRSWQGLAGAGKGWQGLAGAGSMGSRIETQWFDCRDWIAVIGLQWLDCSWIEMVQRARNG